MVAPVNAQQFQTALINGLNIAQGQLSQAPSNAHGIASKITAVTDGLTALRTIGFGSETDSLVGTGLHVSVADWVQRHGINERPLPPTPVVQGGAINFGEGSLSVSLIRTLRVSDDGTTHRLPPNLRPFPMREIKNHQDRAPEDWAQKGGVIVPMYQREALWLLFGGNTDTKPLLALMVGAGLINAVSGGRWSEEMNVTTRAQNYVVGPRPQPWLDGWNAGQDKNGRDVVRQFVAMPLGMGYTVEQHRTGKEKHGGIQLLARRMKPDAMANHLRYHFNGVIARLREPIRVEEEVLFNLRELRSMDDGDFDDGDFGVFRGGSPPVARRASSFGMGLAAGGEIEQQIFRDSHGLDAWDPSEDATGRLWVHLVNSEGWHSITGESPPPTPVTREEYARRRYPWFEFYDETASSANRPTSLATVPGLAEMDEAHGFQTDATAPSPGGPVVVLNPKDPHQVMGVKIDAPPRAHVPGAADEGKWPTDKGGKK